MTDNNDNYWKYNDRKIKCLKTDNTDNKYEKKNILTSTWKLLNKCVTNKTELTGTLLF